MTKVDIFSGFLGAGKTTLIKKLIKEAYCGEKLVLIENEFGQIGIDGGFLREAGIEITEMNSGCICCSLVGDFGEALKKVSEQFSPDRIVIEPSGVGKLSDVIKAVRDADIEGLELNSFTAVIDATKCKMYLKNFAEFYKNQIEFASSVVFSRTAGIKKEKLDEAVELVRGINSEATLITTPWDELDGRAVLDALEKKNTLEAALEELLAEQEHHHHHHECDDPDCDCHEHHHHHHHECDDPDCDCHEHHHHHHECDDPDCDCHEHHHHHHHECDDPDCGCHEHHHHHDHDHDCGCHEHHHHHDHDHDCGCHEHHHHHDHECDDPNCSCHHEGHHHADEVFASWGVETHKSYSEAEVKNILAELDSGKYGTVLRAKGIVACADGGWLHFDYVPGEMNARKGAADTIGKLCVIGAELDKAEISKLFGC